MEELTPNTRYEKFLSAAAGSGTAPDPVTREEKFLKAIADNAGGGSSLPSVSSSDNGKVLAVENGAWAASEQGKKFLVTLTPTALDYSGTMDKTVAEINAAYEAGMEIVFRVMESATTYTEVFLSAVYHDGATYPSFNAFIVGSDANVLIFAGTVTTNDGTKHTYTATIYSLTPAS